MIIPTIVKHWRVAVTLKNVELLAAALFVVASLGVAGEARAQSPYRRYTSPSGRPTITPRLNFFRDDTGAIGDPYNAFVAPRLQLDSQLQQMGKQGQSDFRTNQREIESLRNSSAAPTGTAATFMNYSHYYLQTNPGTTGSARNGRFVGRR